MTRSNPKTPIAEFGNTNALMSSHEARLQVLLKQFVNADAHKELQVMENIVNEVVFESVVDGEQYYLVRCRPKSEEKINLSPREQAIAKLVAQGLPNKSIATHLDISQWTVATHLRRIFGKLGVTSRAAMIARLGNSAIL
jgi:DNA-binding NarL/FixJ family response regulator